MDNDSRSALMADKMSALRSLLPNNRIAPQEMLPDFGAGQNVGAEPEDFVHRRIDIVRLMCGPGGARFARRKQAAVVNQSQTSAH